MLLFYCTAAENSFIDCLVEWLSAFHVLDFIDVIFPCIGMIFPVSLWTFGEFPRRLFQWNKVKKGRKCEVKNPQSLRSISLCSQVVRG